MTRFFNGLLHFRRGAWEMLASVLIVAFQLPLARVARRIGAVRILPVGFLLLSAAFASVALFAAKEPPEGWLPPREAPPRAGCCS